MVLPHGNGDLYHKYRPRRFEEVCGHKEVVASIKKAIMAESPSKAFMLLGDSGTGKTTTARIMALALNCTAKSPEGEPCLECRSCKAILSGSCIDLIELNAADNRGIGDIRNICDKMPLMPMQTRYKVYILDEAHQLTNDAQSSLLKYLEEAPPHVFIILCSTHAEKILPTVKNRCQKFQFKSLSRKDMLALIEEVCTLEGESFSKDVYDMVADASEGSPRNALVLLQQALQLGSKDPKQIAKLLIAESEDGQAIKICFLLNSKSQTNWEVIVSAYEEAKHLGAAAIGMMAAGYFRNQLLKASNKVQAEKMSAVLDLFIEPFAEGKLGENQLVNALYKAHRTIRNVSS